MIRIMNMSSEKDLPQRFANPNSGKPSKRTPENSAGTESQYAGTELSSAFTQTSHICPIAPLFEAKGIDAMFNMAFEIKCKELMNSK